MRPILFDCDGVLVDSEAMSTEATGELLRARGVRMANEEVHRHFLGKTGDAIRAHCAKLGVVLEEDFAERKDGLYLERARGRLRAMPGAREVLERVHGKTKLAVATSGTPAKVAFSLRETRLDRFFEVVVSAVEVARGKPHPDLFLLAAERLKVDPRTCVVVEDSGPGIEAARAANMYVVALASSLDRATLVAAGADSVIDSLDSLFDLVDSLGA